MSKKTPALDKLQDNWINRIKLKYTPLSDDIYIHKRTHRLSELLCAIDHHYYQTAKNTGIDDELGFGKDLQYGIIPIEKSDDKSTVETYVAATIVGDGDNKSVLLITADDSLRLNQYKVENEIEASNIEFKRDEIFIVLKELAGTHEIEPNQVKYINYTSGNLAEHAVMHDKPASREYLRTLYEHKKGMSSFASVYCPDGEYLVSQIKDSKINGIALTEQEQFNYDANNKTQPEKEGTNVEFEHLGHSFDSDSSINKIVVSRFVIDALSALQKKHEDKISKHTPVIEKNDNVRVTCGDHLISVRPNWNEPEVILEALHAEGLTDLTKEDITETITETSQKINAKKLEKALLDRGIDVTKAEHKNPSFSVVRSTNTKPYKEHHADVVAENIESIKQGVENKLDMIEPGDKEENAATSASDAGYGATP